MTLWFVGLGIYGASSAPARALEIISRADSVYLERFTSPIPDADIGVIKGMAGGKIVLAKRWQVEDGREILEDAEKGEAALVSYGDPYVATTHIELRTRATGRGIRTGTIHAASAPAAAIGECGLHNYKVGRTTTIMSKEPPDTPYHTILSNLRAQSHTILLLEYDQERGYTMGPGAALAGLLEAEKKHAQKIISGSTYCIVASRIGADGQEITAGTMSSLEETEFGDGPHTIIIPGDLHFTESDALAASCRCIDRPAGNTAPDVAGQMIARYAPRIREAIAETAGRDARVTDNAENYIRDAEQFLADCRPEVAILSIGYADGLVDALRISAGKEPKA